MPARPGRAQKGRANFYKPGTNNVECDRTGFKVKASDARHEWNGFFVRNESWEQRQPQDFLRGFPDQQQPEVSRPGTGTTFLTELEDVGDPETASSPPPAVVHSNPVKPEDL